MLELFIVDHMESNYSWDMFLWKKFWRTAQFHEFFRNISMLYLC